MIDGPTNPNPVETEGPVTEAQRAELEEMVLEMGITTMLLPTINKTNAKFRESLKEE